MNKRKMLIAASMAGLMAAGVTAAGADALAADVHCYGVNKCKGAGDCGGKGNSCAGHNSCKGKGFVAMPEDTCLQLNGGRLTEAK